MSTGKVTPSTFEWIIRSTNQSSFLEYLKSVSNVWSPEFQLPDSSWYLKLYFICTEWIMIDICRGDSGPPKTITHTIKIKGRTDVKEFTKTTLFRRKHASSEGLGISPEDLALNSIWSITCCIKCNTPHPVPGREFVTCATQTEVTNSRKPKGKEKPKDELSSLDMKGVALLSERMKELLIKGIEHDVTICVKNKEFRAHRNVLSARSPVFAMMFTHDTKENNTGTINIEDCDPESFDEFLLYVYSGRTKNLTPSNAIQLYYSADKYDFPVLKERCVSLLKSSLSVASIFDVVLLAAKHQEKELLEVATEFFARNVKKILVTIGWQKFMSQNPVEANELYIKSMEILLPEN